MDAVDGSSAEDWECYSDTCGRSCFEGLVEAAV